MKPTISLPKILLHLEGLAVLLGSLTAYQSMHGSWGWFAVLFLAPDIGMLGYAAGPVVGAWCYNALHTYAVPLRIGVAGYLAGQSELAPWMTIWVAHIAFDRMLNYGLKYPTAFKDTHLSRV